MLKLIVIINLLVAKIKDNNNLEEVKTHTKNNNNKTVALINRYKEEISREIMRNTYRCIQRNETWNTFKNIILAVAKAVSLTRSAERVCTVEHINQGTSKAKEEVVEKIYWK